VAVIALVAGHVMVVLARFVGHAMMMMMMVPRLALVIGEVMMVLALALVVRDDAVRASRGACAGRGAGDGGARAGLIIARAGLMVVLALVAWQVMIWCSRWPWGT
jgi:hypothetical protein